MNPRCRFGVFFWFGTGKYPDCEGQTSPCFVLYACIELCCQKVSRGSQNRWKHIHTQTHATSRVRTIGRTNKPAEDLPHAAHLHVSHVVKKARQRELEGGGQGESPRCKSKGIFISCGPHRLKTFCGVEKGQGRQTDGGGSRTCEETASKEEMVSILGLRCSG